MNPDLRMAKAIEKVLLQPRPAFQSPAEFSVYLASKLEPVVQAREEVAFRMGEASAELHADALTR